jgi:spore germination protein GerM
VDLDLKLVESIDRAHPLGGEGLILRQPITRNQFEADFPLNQ